MLKRFAMVVLLAASATGVGVAQTGDPGAQSRGRSGRPAGDGLPAAEVVRMLDGWAIMQAQESLALNDEQYAQFVTRLRRLQDVRRQNQRERTRLLQDLRRMAGPQAGTPDEGAIRERVKALRDLDDRAHAEARNAYDALDEVLDARQQARFRLFEEMIERRKLDLLVRARERAARGGGD